MKIDGMKRDTMQRQMEVEDVVKRKNNEINSVKTMLDRETLKLDTELKQMETAKAILEKSYQEK
jgi:hypothetical protein